MSEPDSGSTTTPPGNQAPGSRVRPRLVIAVAVAAVMLLGIVGLIVVAVLGDDDDPTGAGLERQLNVEEPATAPLGTDGGGNPATQPSAAGSGPSGTGGSTEVGPDTTSEADDVQSGEAGTTTTAPPTVDTAAPVNSIAPLQEGDETPPTPSEPVEFPVLVTNPAPPTTFAAVPLGELGAETVAALDGWSLSSRDGDHVAFTSDDQALDVFVLGDAVTASEAMEEFYDDRVGSDLGDVTESPITLLGAPTDRFVSVAGSQYVATAARQQGTVVVSGSTVTAVGTDGRAVVIATSRIGTSSPDELAADGELLRSLLAHL